MQLEDFAARCAWPPKEAAVRARLQVLGFLVNCKRCSGTGRYEDNPADPRCYGCAGLGKKLPPLTARLAAVVRKRQDAGDLDSYYARLRERRGASGGAGDENQQELVREIVAYAGRSQSVAQVLKILVRGVTGTNV